MYEELAKRLRSAESNYQETLDCLSEAADAIEELSRENESLAKSVNEAAELLHKRRTSPKWIPVTERLPSWGEDVLISISRFCNVGHLVQTNDEKQYNWYYSGWYHDPMEVTHWMPLPEPPKEE